MSEQQQKIYVTQGEAQSARGNQNGGGTHQSNADGEATLRSDGNRAEHLSGGTDRAIRPPATTTSVITGGILAQLIKQTEDQLGNAAACVEWYEREHKKLAAQLEELRKLKEQNDEEPAI